MKALATGGKRQVIKGELIKAARLIVLAGFLVISAAPVFSYTEDYGYEFGIDFGVGLMRNKDLTQSFHRLGWIFLSDNPDNLWQQYRVIAERDKVEFNRPNMLTDFGLCFVLKKRLFYDYIIKERFRIGYVRMENFGADVHLRFHDPGDYEPGNYDVGDYYAQAQYFQEWSGGAVSFSFSQYFGVGGEVWEAYIGYGLGLSRGTLSFEWIVREGSNEEHPEWDAWYMDGSTKKHYSVEQKVAGTMSSDWGFEQFMFAELNRRIAGKLYFCAGASFHWVWLDDYRGEYTMSYIRDGESLLDETGDGVLLIFKDIVGIQPVVVPLEELSGEGGYRPLTIDFIGPRLSLSLRYFL